MNIIGATVVVRALCDCTRRYGVPGNENEECIFCMLVLQYHNKKLWRTGTFRDRFKRNSKNA